jgi:hypothetical protein
MDSSQSLFFVHFGQIDDPRLARISQCATRAQSTSRCESCRRN